MNLLCQLLGLLICGLVALQLVVYLLRATTHFLAEREFRRLRIWQLREEIASLRATQIQQRPPVPGWDGWRKFEVAGKVPECSGCYSFHLVPHDGQPLPEFQPGQYLTFQLVIPGQAQKVVRCYSLSDRHHEDHYRVTIKKALPPSTAVEAAPGVSSTYFHDHVQPGDILDVKAPRGKFVLDRGQDIPVVLLAGGVGITPMMSMARTLLAAGSARHIYLFAGFSNSQSHIFKHDLEQLAAEHETLTLTVCYSDPTEADEQSVDYQVGGHIDLPLLKAQLPAVNCDFYLCGPGRFMESLTEGLEQWGVPAARIHTEAFGPSSLKRNRQPTAAPVNVVAGAGAKPVEPDFAPAGVEVRFDRSNRQCVWLPSYNSLLDLAEANGIEIESGCRAGHCGTCLTAVKIGTVHYHDEAAAACEEGTCLPCIGIPAGELILDA